MARRGSGSTADDAIGSPPQQVVDRVRFILVICVTVGPVLAALDVLGGAHPLGAQFAVRAVGLALAAVGIGVLRSRWALEHAQPVGVGTVAVAYLFTALAGVVSEPPQYATQALLFVGAALFTGTMVPWGFRAQVATAAVAAAALAGAVLGTDGTLAALATEPGAAVLSAFILSAIAAREFDRYRAAHRHELGERQRAEAALRRLNLHLEDRVVERTAALQTVNDRLAGEVAERRRAIDALRASETLLADTVDYSTAIVSLKDVRGRYLLVNREFERLFDEPRLRVVGRRDAELFAAPLAERLAMGDEDVLRDGAPLSFEIELPVGDVARGYVCVKFPLRGADGAPYGVGSMATDITLLKQLQEELTRHREELAQVLRLHTIGEMTAALAHEINQPLCAIANYAHGGAQRLRTGAVDPAALLQAFEHIASEGLRAGQILRGIRTVIQRDRGDAALVDVNAIAAEAMRVVEPQARQHGVTVRLECAADLPPVQASRSQIEQVLINLVLNGVQAIGPTSGAHRDVIVATSRAAGGVEVTVRDTGAGIAPTVAARLFTPFVTTKTGGFGLGLAISRSIVENHGGRLWAVADVDAGAAFRFSLPAAAS